MRANNILGILFSNSYDDALPELTGLRTMGSVPFGCRYRLIDFPLSSMVNAGISKVGVVTKSNYRSLMDHLGNGKPWDLSRKHEGLLLLPPFVGVGSGGNQTRLEGLCSAMEFLRNSKEEYVVMSDCNLVCNLDYHELLRRHQESGAELSIACKRGKAPALRSMRFAMDQNSRITDITLGKEPGEDQLYSLNIFFLRKAVLERLIQLAQTSGDSSFFTTIQKNLASLQVHGMQVAGYARIIDSMQSYYDVNMELLLPENREAVFQADRPVLTKVQDDMPAVYGLHSYVQNSLVADGCQIRGGAENCVLFRNVRIEPGAVVRSCILMQNTCISADATLSNVIADKGVIIKPGKTLMGAENYPIYLGKKIVV
ncbi:MAG: glucose-1-phosphate adenylyltransferase subunit GlgD [Oscillospiraceae bacterium]|nr:glucose-1-phosphate adenylyltransferase subunit GlgD [Oscillospiraceae bacterium]